jgi:hypothetical protein
MMHDALKPATVGARRTTFEAVQGFLEGLQPGPRGLTLDEVLSEDDDFFEDCHDFVQWLFPLNSASEYHPAAPVLDVAELAALSPAAKAGTAKAFVRMLSFYGLVYDAGHVRIGSNWDARMGDWVAVPTHNSLRLTRVLRSLAMQGLLEESKALLAFLLGLFSDRSLPATRQGELAYWRQAVLRPWVNGLE